MAARVTSVALLLVLGLQCATALSAQSHAEATPLSKVIELLNGMMVKGKKMMETEQVEYAKYSTWCAETKDNLNNSIKEATQEIAAADADAAKAAADAETLASEIADLEEELASLEAEEKNATSVRGKEHESFVVTRSDFAESIDAIKRAITVLKARTADVPQSLIQVSRSSLVPEKVKATLTSFLSMQEEPSEMAPPEANAYEFQSSSVIDMLQKLQLKFQDQMLALQKAEMSAKHNYEVLLQQLTDDQATAEATIAKKTEAKNTRLADNAKAIEERTVVAAAKAEDEKTLATTTAECAAATKEHNKNQQLRADELQALQEATEILMSEDVSGNADKYLPKFVQLRAVGKPTLLAQLRTTVQDNQRMKAVQLLQAHAEKYGDKYLATIAEHVAADPFGKVKSMIKDLIIKLQEEANAEADQHAYCTTELAKNKMTREDKSAEVDKLTAELDELTATSTLLGKEIGELSTEIAEIREQQAGATQIRQEEKADNNVTIADAKVAQVAVEKAKQVLAAYYAKAAESLLQRAATEAPYKGMQTASGNIMDFLEVIMSDFARLEAETSAAEEAAQAAYEKFMADSNQDIAVKDTEMKHKEDSKSATDEKARTTKKELELTQSELDAALEYYEKLKPECVDKSLSYAERKQAREEEIQSLKEALNVLEGEDLA